MPELRVRAVASRNVTGLRRLFAPNLLRPHGGSCGIPSTWRSPTAPCGSALGEVDGMPHPCLPPPHHQEPLELTAGPSRRPAVAAAPGARWRWSSCPVRVVLCGDVPPLLAPCRRALVRNWSHTRRLPVPAPACQCHPVDLAQPDRADARGRPSTRPEADVVKLRPRASVW